jgi:hypothetical protein
VKPEVQGLESRQLLNAGHGFSPPGAFARSFEGGPANDIAVFRPSNGTWYIAEAATGFNTNTPLVVQWGAQGDIPVENSDFFGNGHADLAVFRPSTGYWYIKDPVTGATIATQWGMQGDVPVGSSDFFGYGHADLVVFRPCTGTWYIKDPLNGTTSAVAWGEPGDVPIANAHFDGGLRSDIAVYRPSNQTWYVLTQSSNYNPSYAIVAQWGTQGDVPIFNSDFFGSGHDDFAVFRPSNGTWYVKDPATGWTITSQWGTQGDVPLASSDFFGDGRADFAVFRPSDGTWYIRDPGNGRTLSVQWGTQGDQPLANADFDGDGRADIAVFRPGDDTWHILTSSSNYNPLYQIERQWGATSDEAIGAPAAPDPIFILGGDLGAGAQYHSFEGDPLFASDGPSPNDIAQGGIGDCSVLSRLHAVAEMDPARIRRTIFDMGNGLYGVDLQPYGEDQYVIVNADLPTDSYGNLLWAHLGHQNSLWVALIEKAWTFAKPVPSNVYTQYVGTDQMIDGSGFGTLWDAMGFTSSTVNTLYQLETALASGQAVVACTVGKVSAGSQLSSQHVYHVEAINYAWVGVSYIPVSVRLYNPWGFFVTVAYSDFVQNMASEVSAYA